MDKRDIVEVVSEYVILRKTGREYTGLCPLHTEKTPSFFVNPEKQVFYCHGCHAGGSVADFLMKLHGLSFQEACGRLGIETDEPRSAPTAAQRKAGERAAAWMAEQRRKINVLLGVALEEIDLADEIGDSELAESLLRERSFLRDLYDDLEISRYAADLLSIRPTIEELTEGVEVLEIHLEFPALTAEYRAYLQAVAGGCP